MIAALQGIKYLAYAAAGVALIAIVAYVMSSYEMSGKINLMQAALNNATTQAATAAQHAQQGATTIR